MAMLESRLRPLLRRIGSEPLVFLTGAGISAESGVPTFRGEEGYWTVGSTHYRPTDLATNAAFRRMPEDVWSWYLYRRTVCLKAQPNAGHTALAALEQTLGGRFLLVTQNVDGLHRRAGNSDERIYEVHGNIDQMRCWEECTLQPFPIPQGVGPKERGEPFSEQDRALLVCPRCGGPARPHVLWFDECYDEERFRFESSLRAVKNAGALITVGSSGATNLPMQMVRLAAANGAVIIDINPHTNAFAQLAQATGGLWVDRPSAAALDELRSLLEERS
jgi:NAD-dependent deacetylase